MRSVGGSGAGLLPGTELAGIGAALLAVALRCLEWRQCFRGGEAVPHGVDGSYHLWRAESLVASFPAIPLHDAHVSFPQGGAVPWPPGLDLVFALPGFLGLGSKAVAAWAALLMPLFGGLAVYLLYRFGRAVFDPATGLAAAFILALLPAAVSDTMVGRIDHHAVVAPLTLGIFLSFLAALRSASREKALAWGICCGLLAAAAVLSWPISPPLFFLPVPLTLLLLRWTEWRRAAYGTAVVCLVSSLVFVLLAVILIADLARSPFDLYRPSLFIVVPYLLAAVLVPPFLERRRFFLAAAGLLLLSTAVAAVVFPGWREPLRQVLQVAGGEDASYTLAAEALPLFADLEGVSLDYAVRYFTYLVLLAPFLLVACAWKMIRGKDFAPPRVLFGVYAATGFVLVVLQSRFREFTAPAYSLLIAWMLLELGRLLAAPGKESPRGRRQVVLAALAVFALGWALSPMAADLYGRVRRDTFDYPSKVYDFGREFAASDLDRLKPEERGSVGLLASWADSHRLLHATKLPVMVSSFGTTEAQRMNEVAFRALLARDEEEAFGTLEANRIRFVVVSSLFSEVEGMARVAGLEQDFLLINRGMSGPGRYQLLPPFLDSLHSRLYLGYGSTTDVFGYRLKPLSHFRLVAESEWGESVLGLPRTMMAAFEVVRGGRIRGRAGPLSPVVLSLDLRTNLGRTFRYVRRVVSDSEGWYEFVVPYATSTGTGRTRALGPYRLESARGGADVEVGAGDVTEGRTILVGKGGV